jgi:hypothetical protein
LQVELQSVVVVLQQVDFQQVWKFCYRLSDRQVLPGADHLVDFPEDNYLVGEVERHPQVVWVDKVCDLEQDIAVLADMVVFELVVPAAPVDS